MDDKLLDVGTILTIDLENPINQGRSALASYSRVVNKVFVDETGKCLYQIAWYHHPTPFDSPLAGVMFDYLDVKPYTGDELLSWLRIVTEKVEPNIRKQSLI